MTIFKNGDVAVWENIGCGFFGNTVELRLLGRKTQSHSIL